MADTKNTETWLKHLDYIQAAINRMAANSATQKNYCITLITAIVGAALISGTDELLYLALAAVAMFGFLDTKYLQNEKGFRKLYDEIRRETNNKTDFRMMPVKVPFHHTIISWAIWPFYTALTLGVVLMKWILL